MDRHNQTHNDIKPQNFLVKFKNGSADLTQIDIVLTDFGMAGADSKGGTPIFASPECFEKKDKKSDIFSFGRVILFLLLTKNQFAKWLFVPIKDYAKVSMLRNLFLYNITSSSQKSKLMVMVSRVSKLLTGPEHCLNMVTQMTSVQNRISLKLARTIFKKLKRVSKIKLSNDLITEIDTIVNSELTPDFNAYVSELCDHRLENTVPSIC